MFLGDQGRDAIVVKRIVTLQHFPAIGPPSSVGQLYLGPFFYYLISPFLLIFKFDPVGLAYAVALFSSVGIILSYLVIKSILNRKIAFNFLIFLAFSFTNIEFSRFSWNPNLLPFFSFLTLYFFYKFLDSKKILYSILLGILLSFSVQLHHLSFLLFLPISFFSLLQLFRKESRFGYIKKLFPAIISFFITSSPLLIFDIKHGFLNSRNFIKLFTSPDFVTNTSYLSRLLETVHGLFMHVFKITFNPVFAGLLFLFFLLSYLTFNNKSKSHLFLKIHYSNIIFFVFAFALLNTPRLPHYFGLIYYSFFAIAAYVSNILSKRSPLLNVSVGLFLIIYLFLNGKNYYFLTSYGSYQIRSAKNIAQSISRHISASPFQIVSLPPTQTDGHIRYFIELAGHTPLPQDSSVQPSELFVLCFLSKCKIPGDPQWQIAAFSQAKVDTIWTINDITIYKVVHAK